MATEEIGNQPAIKRTYADSRQINIIVDGYKVKLNYPQKPDETVIREVKRMILGGVLKTC